MLNYRYQGAIPFWYRLSMKKRRKYLGLIKKHSTFAADLETGHKLLCKGIRWNT